MDKNYYALNYRPKKAYYGQEFLYDGENGFDEWKDSKTKKKEKFKYKDYYEIRDAFVHNNREIVDDIFFGENVRNYNVKDVSNFISTATNKDTRIAQTIAAKKSWEKIRDISHGTGTVIGFDIETIGDAIRENLYTVGENLQNYDGHAGITEIGFYLKSFVDGEFINNSKISQEKTIAVGLNGKQLAYAKETLSKYKKEGLSVLDKNDEWMLKWFSRYGNGPYSTYFNTEKIDFLGDNKFVTINTDKLSDMDIFDVKAIEKGIENWQSLMNDSKKSIYTNKEYVLKNSIDFFNKSLNDESSALVAANVGYEATVISKEAEALNIKLNVQELYENTADIVYANETIASANGISVYKMQQRTGNKISPENAKAPASTQTSMQAAGMKDIKEHHSGGKDSKVETDIATNKLFIDKPFSEEVLDSIDIERQKNLKNYSENYYVFKSGWLNKNKMDHAIVDGQETQSYSYRNQYLSIDLEHSGYVPFTPQTKEGVVAESQDVYILSMTNDRGDIIRKQYPTEDMAFADIDENAMSIPKAHSEEYDRIYQENLNYKDLARREYDRMLNSTDITTSSGEEINGFNQMKKVLNLVNEIDESGKGLKYVTDEKLKEIGFKSVTQKRTFEPLYDMIESEKSVLNYIVNYIDENMSTANNTQKTIALNDMMSVFKKEVENLGFKKTVFFDEAFESAMILEDALGIDVLVGDEYTRINGNSEETIRKGLRNAFKNSNKKDILKSINDLKNRGVLNEYALESIKDNNLPRNTYNATIIPDIAKELSDVMEPITTHEDGPISFFDTLDESNVNYKAVTNKITRSIHDDTINKSTSFYFMDNLTISLSEIFEDKEIRKSLEEKNLLNEFDKIINNSYNMEFIDGKGLRNKFLAQLGDELNYSHEQKKTLIGLFEAKEGGEYKNYAIDGRKDIRAFVIPPVENANGSAFLILTNENHQANVNEILKDSIDDINKAESRKSIEEIVEGHASVIELKNYNKTSLGTFDQFGIPKEVAQFFDVSDINVTTVKQGKTAEKFMVPIIDSYITKVKDTNKEIFNIGIKPAGDSYVSAIRTPLAKVLDFVSAGEFPRGTRAGYQATNSYMKTLSSPSSGRAYKDVNGQLKRAINYNLSDLLHGFYIDGSGVRKAFEYEAEYALKNKIMDSPIYQMIEAIGLQTGKINEEKGLDLNSLKNILSSGEWNEFYTKNLFLGTVNDDKSFAEAIAKFGINSQSSNFDKNIITMITEFAKEYSDGFSKYSIETLEGIQKASPYLSQLLNETNVEKDIWTLLNAGDLIDLGGLNATLRPTYGQVLNALMFNPSELNYFANDTIIGATSKSLYEKIIFDNIDIKAPSGLPYNSQERLVTTTFKQMSDAELQLRYREIYGNLEDLAKKNNLDVKKLEETYRIFTNEYMSVHESKILGAPKFFNQEPFTSPDVKKISMPQLAKLKGDAKEVTERKINEYIGKELTTGDIIGYSGGKAIYYEGPSTILTEDNIKELFKDGETRVVPSSRAGMITDIKVMLQQEKATMHFALIDDVFMKKNTIYQNKEEAMKYMQKMFHFVVGYDGSHGYEPVAFGVLDSFKHGTNIASDSTFRIIAHEYEKAGRLGQLQDALNRMEEFEGWNFSIDKKHGREYLISNQKAKTGMTNAIHKLYDIIMDDTKRKEYGLDFDGFKIKDILQHIRKNNLAYLELQRMNMNEIMGTSVTLDERMQQAIRLRSVNDGNYYVGKYVIDGVEMEAVDGVLDGINGKIVNGRGRRWDDLYLDELKSDISKGVYDKMNVSEFDEFSGIRTYLSEKSIERQAKFASHRKAVAKQKNIIGGIKESVMWYNDLFDVSAHDVINVDMKTLLERLPKQGGITADDLQDFIFKTDGEASRYLKEITGDNIANKTSIYLDFGTTIGNKKGMLIPLIDVNTTGDNVFFNRTEGSIIKFFNEYQSKIGTVTGKEEIKKAMDDLYNSFARELVVFDKDSLAYKLMGKTVLPNSTQSLAHDEVAPLVDAIIDDPFIKDSIELEKEYRMAIADGDKTAIEKLDNLLKKRKEIANEVADIIKSGDITDDSYYKLAGLSTVGRADKGYIDYIVSDDGLMRPIKYAGQELKEGQSIKRMLTNTFDTSLKNLKDHGLDINTIDLQLMRDYLANGKITLYETNDAFDNFMKNVDFAKISSEVQKLAEDYDIALEPSKTGAIGDIDNFMISIRNLNKEIIDSSKNEIRKADDIAIERLYEILNKHGIARKYLSEVGILTREVNRYPIFKSQSIARIFLNEGLEGSEIRANNPIVSIVTNVDHDGDMYMSSLDLNGGGIKTVKQQANLIAAYENSLSPNNEMFAKLIRDEVAFKADDITDISLYRLKELEKLDSISYRNVMQEWIIDNNLSGSVDDLSDGQILAAAHHSIKVRKAVETFDARRNSLTDLDMLKAALVSRARKKNIGSVSTPNFKLRDTLNTIYSNPKYQDLDRKKAFDILKHLTNLKGEGLTDITEQKGIDVKHIFDAVNIAETPKWVKGASMLFNKKGYKKTSQDGLYLMMEAANNSTFKLDKNVLEKIHKDILNNTLEDLEKRSIENEKEALKKLLKSSSYETFTDKQVEDILNFTVKFRALYDSTTLPEAYTIHNLVFRSKSVTHEEMAKALNEIQQYGLSEFSENAVFSDFVKEYKKAYSDENLLIDDKTVYFKTGDVAKREAKRGKAGQIELQNGVIDKAYVLKNIDGYKVTLQEVDMHTLKPIKDSTKDISGKNYQDINLKLRKFLDDTEGINKFAYNNSALTRDKNFAKLKINKFNRNINAMIFNTGYKDANGFEAFHNFMSLGKEKRFYFGEDVYDFIRNNIGGETTIKNIRETLKDAEWAIQEGKVSKGKSVPALIRELNKAIVEKSNNFTRTYNYNFDTFVDRFFEDNLFKSKEVRQQVRQKRLSLGDFKNDIYNDKIDFLNKNIYGTINAREKLDKFYDTLEAFKSRLKEDSVPQELTDFLKTRETTINDFMNKTYQHNDKIIKEAQDEIYKLFKNTNQMDLKFDWKIARGNSLVGFGEYLNTPFKELKQQDVDKILSTNISQEALDKISNPYQRYATQKTVELLKEYSSTNNINPGTITSNKPIMDSIGDFTTAQSIKFGKIIRDVKPEAINPIPKKKLSDSFKDTFSNINVPKKTIGIVVGSMAALGIANNLLHNQKNKSPLTPERRPNGNGAPGINGNYPESSQPMQAPMSQKKTIYHDKSSGFNFKVSASTNNYIHDSENAKLIGMSGGGQTSVYSQSDMSGVTDNWLANKFAELA